MTEQTPLERYTALKFECSRFADEHRDIIAQYHIMADDLARSEAELKAWARDNGSTENESFVVAVQHKTRKWYDADKILELAPYVRDIPGVVVETIDKAKIETLAKGGMIDANVAAQAYREEPLTPAVSIKEKVKP